MHKLVTVGCLVVAAGIGLVIRLRRLRFDCEMLDFAKSYIEHLKSYCESHGKNLKVYSWLIHRSSRMQREMGNWGRIGIYQAPFGRYTVRDYEIVLNMLPMLRRSLEEASGFPEHYANTLEEAILRYIGALEDRIDNKRRELANPLGWLTETARVIVSVPAYLLSSVGLIGLGEVTRFRESKFTSLVAGIVTLLMLLSTLMTIFLGWHDFITMLFGE